MLPKSVTVSKYLLTVTLFACPKSVNVTEDVCTAKLTQLPLLHLLLGDPLLTPCVQGVSSGRGPGVG